MKLSRKIKVAIKKKGRGERRGKKGKSQPDRGFIEIRKGWNKNPIKRSKRKSLGGTIEMKMKQTVSTERVGQCIFLGKYVRVPPAAHLVREFKPREQQRRSKLYSY